MLVVASIIGVQVGQNALVEKKLFQKKALLAILLLIVGNLTEEKIFC